MGRCAIRIYKRNAIAASVVLDCALRVAALALELFRAEFSHILVVDGVGSHLMAVFHCGF